MLVELMFDVSRIFLVSVDRQEPPQDVTVAKHIRQLVEVCLLLEFY